MMPLSTSTPDLDRQENLAQLTRTETSTPPEVTILQLLRRGFPREHIHPRLLGHFMGTVEHCFPCVLRFAFQRRDGTEIRNCSAAPDSSQESCLHCLEQGTACFRIPIDQDRVTLHNLWGQGRYREPLVWRKHCQIVAIHHHVRKQRYREAIKPSHAQGTPEQLANAILLDNEDDDDDSVIFVSENPATP